MTDRDVLAVTRIAGECRELWADPTSWRLHLMDGARRLTGQACVVWAELAPMSIDAPPEFRVSLDIGWRDEAARRYYVSYAQQLQTNTRPFPGYRRLIRRLNERGSACMDRTQVCPERTRWERSRFLNDFRLPAGHDGFILSFVHHVDSAVHTHLAVHQDIDDPSPTSRDRTLLSLLHHVIAELYGHRLATEAHAGPGQLTPRLRDTLSLLLEGLSEKEIAARSNIRPATCHEYVGRIFAHFGVRSRAELMAVFVRARPLPKALPGEVRHRH